MTRQEIGAILKQLRTSRNMTQKEIAEKLGRNQQIIGHWETGYAQPDLDTFIRLCKIYHTTVDSAFGGDSTSISVSPAEYDYILKYRSLDPQARQHVDIFIQWETEKARPAQFSRLLAYYVHLTDMFNSKKAAAPPLKLQVPDNELSRHADLITVIPDDSMEDVYHSGDHIYVKESQVIPTGCIGVYMQDNHTLVRESGPGHLSAYNPAYPDIPADESITAIGFVLGKVA